MTEGRSRSRRKYCEWKTYQLFYQATFLFTHYVISGATKNHAGKASGPKPLSRLYPVPPHTVAKTHLCLPPSALWASVYGVCSAQDIPPPTSLSNSYPLGPSSSASLHKAFLNLHSQYIVPLWSHSVSRHYQIGLGGRNHSWLKITALGSSNMDCPVAVSPNNLLFHLNFSPVGLAFHGGLPIFGYRYGLAASESLYKLLRRLAYKFIYY